MNGEIFYIVFYSTAALFLQYVPVTRGHGYRYAMDDGQDMDVDNNGKWEGTLYLYTYPLLI